MLQKEIITVAILILSFAKTVGQPVISSFTPLSGAVGSTVAIAGSGFSAVAQNNTVYFGSVKAVVTSATNNALLLTVPAGATYQPITVTTAGLTAASLNPFTTTFTTSETAISDFTFNTNRSFLSNAFSNMVIVDFDGDGKPDIAGCNGGGLQYVFYILRNTSTSAGQISFADRQPFATNDYCASLESSDLDGDGKKDIVITTGDAAVSFYRNTSVPGNISFVQTDMTETTQPAYYVLGIYDLDGDGKPEIVLSNGLDSMSIYKNTSTPGNILFTHLSSYFTGNPPGLITFADIDVDGFADMIYSNGTHQNTFSVYRNNGSGGFPTKVDVATGIHPSGIAASDIDADGKIDISITHTEVDTISVYRNISGPGNISFSQRINLAIPIHSYNCSVNDLNGDGKPDIFASTIAGSVFVFQNMSTAGNIQFAAGHLYDTNGSSYGPLSSADFDDDNKPDIAVGYVGYVYILRNRLDEPNITSFYPSTAGSLVPVQITGSNFNNVSAVYFGDSSAYSFTVDSPSQITAMVGTGTTGAVKLVQANGNCSLPGFTYTVPVNMFQCPPVANADIPCNIQFAGSYQWQVNKADGNGFVNLSNSSNYSGVTTQILHLINAPSSYCAYTYRCLADGVLYSWPYVLNFRNYWNGGTSNNWEDAGNWSCGAVPDDNTNVVINSGSMQINSNVSIRTLTLNPAVNLTVSSGNSLTITHYVLPVFFELMADLYICRNFINCENCLAILTNIGSY